MTDCSKCRTAIRGENEIRGSGICEKFYHLSKKCEVIDQYSAKIMNENNFISFMLDYCLVYVYTKH